LNDERKGKWFVETLAKRLEKKGRNNELGEYEFQRERDLREW
jgi:hypothetical protein